MRDGDASVCESGPLAPTLSYVRDVLIPRVAQTRDELASIYAALEGRHVLPGGSGAPTRGMADVLPSGHNFYTVDPLKLPTPAAWEIGVALGDALLERYRTETGQCPDTIGMVVCSVPTMRTMGEDIAQNSTCKLTSCSEERTPFSWREDIRDQTVIR